MSDPSRWHPNLIPQYHAQTMYSQSQHSDFRDYPQNDHYEDTTPNPAAPPIRPVAPAPTPTLLRPLQPSPYPSAYPPLYSNTTAYDQQMHTRPSTPIPQDSKVDTKRTRITRACDACRRKKVKCDTSIPGNTCKNCKSSGSNCTYNDCAKKRGPPKGYIEVLENRLKRVEKILGNFADDHTDLTTINDDTDDQSSDRTTRDDAESPPKKLKRKHESNGKNMSQNTNDNHHQSAAADNNEHNQQHQQEHEQTTSATVIGVKTENQDGKIKAVTSGSSTAEKPLAVELSSISTEMRTRYIGDMSPLPFLAQKINLADARICSKIGIRIKRFGQSLVLYEKDDEKDANQRLLERLGMLKPGETINGLNDWIYKVAGVDKTTSDTLMKIYFAYIHPGLPVVNKQLFLQQYRGEIGEYPSAPLLNAIYGAAIRYIETCKLFGDKVPLEHKIETKEGWSERLFDNMIQYVKDNYNPCIATVQALVISQNHRASLDEKMASGWLLNSAAIRMAQDLGLHRSSEKWDIPTSEKETRRRVWWSVYIMDKWSSAATGRPQTIFDEDCDEIYPSESASWEEVMDAPPHSSSSSAADADAEDDGPRYPSLSKQVASKAKRDSIPIYQPFVQIAKLSEILGRILQGLYTPLAKRHSEKYGSDAIVTYLDKALSEWRSNLPPSLQISTMNVRRLSSHNKLPLQSMSGLIYLSYCTLLILLHRPFIEKDGGQKTRSSQSSLSICTSAATRCVDIAEKMHYRDFLLVSWNFAMYPVFTASLIHIYNASNADSIISDVAKSNIIRATGVIKMLSKLTVSAEKLYHVLAQLTKIQAISIPELEPLYDADNNGGENGNDDHHQDDKHLTIEASPLTVRTGGGRISDVGRGSRQRQHSQISQSSQQQQQRDDASLKDLHSPSGTILSDNDLNASANSTPTSGHCDWINGLYSSMQSDNVLDTSSKDVSQQQKLSPSVPQQHQQAVQQPLAASMQSAHPLESDPCSLRQFGLLDMDQIPAAVDQQTEFNSTLNYQQLPFSSTSTGTTTNTNNAYSHPSFIPPANLADSLLFTSSDLTINNVMQPFMSNFSAAFTAINNPYVPNNGAFAAPSSSSLSSEQQHQAMMDQTVFRNRPDNPFWSIPSSIELNDWTAYLLPQQANSSAPATITSTSNSSQSSQQQPPSNLQ